MRRKWWLFLIAPPAMVLFGWLFGATVMHLWNWLMPALFGLRTITFWQGLGLLVLARILVGGVGGGGGGRHGRRHRQLAERWAHLTPEEREKMREWMRTRGDRGCAPGPKQEPA